jgi:hypothetical protein
LSRRKRTSAAAQPKPANRSWRDYSDSLIRSFPRLPSPPSLRPDADTVFAAAAGDKHARAIVASYACRLPVVLVAEVLQ